MCYVLSVVEFISVSYPGSISEDLFWKVLLLLSKKREEQKVGFKKVGDANVSNLCQIHFSQVHLHFAWCVTALGNGDYRQSESKHLQITNRVTRLFPCFPLPPPPPVNDSGPLVMITRLIWKAPSAEVMQLKVLCRKQKKGRQKGGINFDFHPNVLIWRRD